VKKVVLVFFFSKFWLGSLTNPFSRGK